ncbi:hypothetical protein O988_03781 [Pseudogymnoascus sp. VKM F-3808]|nr:hypothetical protein O988_03781 [Pseudogymnoascus sp. VKM F-3808]
MELVNRGASAPTAISWMAYEAYHELKSCESNANGSSYLKLHENDCNYEYGLPLGMFITAGAAMAMARFHKAARPVLPG